MSFFGSIAFMLFILYSSNISAHEAANTPKTYVLNGKSLPLGNGKISTEPKRGYVYSCTTDFNGGGAQFTGPWIHGATWDETQKITVQGNVAWPNASFIINRQQGVRQLIGNALPIGHTTGTFPIQLTDPAYQIDRNPNSIKEQEVMLSLPLMPTAASQPTCVPMGMIGIALDGTALFNALDAAGRDAVAHEVQDHCNGHPERNGQYHYHGPSKCIEGAMDNNQLLGYALDGFGIYSMFDENGRELTNADLDECHGRVSEIEWDGKKVKMYHYVLTREYPYTISCFRGTPIQTSKNRRPAISEQDQPTMPPAGFGQRQPATPPAPPAEAINACKGWTNGAGCSFVSPRGDRIQGTCRSLGETTACVPRGHP